MKNMKCSSLILILVMHIGCTQRPSDPSIKHTTVHDKITSMTDDLVNKNTNWNEYVIEIIKNENGWISSADHIPFAPGAHLICEFDGKGNLIAFHRGR